MSPSPETSSDSYQARTGDDLRWFATFKGTLAALSSRTFVDWAAAAAAPKTVLERNCFGPEDLKPWLGHISILQWDDQVADFRYRLFGSSLPEILGADLTGQSLQAWPAHLARTKRHRLHCVTSRAIPAVVRSVALHDLSRRPRDGYSVLEQVIWPLRYGPGEANAVLDFTTIIPAEVGLNAATLHASTGRQSQWLMADGSCPLP